MFDKNVIKTTTNYVIIHHHKQRASKESCNALLHNIYSKVINSDYWFIELVIKLNE